MTSRVLLLLVPLATACGSYQQNLGTLGSVGIVSPSTTPFTVAGVASDGVAIQCSVSDPVVAVTLVERACGTWTGTLENGELTNTQVSTSDDTILAHHEQIVYSDLGAITFGFEFGSAYLRAVATCSGSGARSTLPAAFALSGAHTVSLGVGDISALAPLANHRVLGVGATQLVSFDPQGTNTGGFGEFTTTTYGSLQQLGADPILHVVDDDIVVTERCVEAWCAADGRVVAAVPGGDFTRAAVQSHDAFFVGVTKPHRLAFYVRSTAGDSILLTNADLSSPTTVPLPYAVATASLTSGVSSSGALVVAVASQDSTLHLVTIDPTAESVSEHDIGAAAFAPDFLWVDPDASYLVYGAKSGGFAFRSATATSDSGSFSSATAAQIVEAAGTGAVFIGNTFVVGDDRSRVVAYDQAGKQAWATVVPSNITGLATAGAYVIASTLSGAAVLDANGGARFTQPNLPYTAPYDVGAPTYIASRSSWIGDDQGNLYAAVDFQTGARLVDVVTADATFAAPAHLCSSTDCGGGPVDLGTDPANCGACGNTCAQGGACVAAHCQSACAGELVDLQQDVLNCGACGNACTVMHGVLACYGGVCQSGPPEN